MIGHSNTMIFQILDANDLKELFLPEEDTEIRMEESIACPRNAEDSKKYKFPLPGIFEWMQYLKNLEDVLEISEETAEFSADSGTGTELKVALTLKVKGAMKQPKKEKAFEKVFFPLHDMLLKLLSERLSYQTYLHHAKNHPPHAASSPSTQEPEETDLAQSAIA